MKKHLLIRVLFFTIGMTNFYSIFANSNHTLSIPLTEGIKVRKISANEIPSDIKYEGTIQEAFRWTDAEGEHIFISTLTDEINTNPDSDMAPWKKIYLYGYHYILENGKNKLRWKVTDYIKECEFEIGVNFRKPCEITDLDNDGIAEIWMMYTLSCSNDVNPETMKIILYEGVQKFAMRGTSKVVVSLDANNNKTYAGGNYTMDQALKHAPEVIKKYALAMWQKHVTR